MSCVFCTIDSESIILKNDLAFVIKDKYPLSKGHLLVIPFRHYENYFDSTEEELSAFRELIFKTKALSDDLYKPSGYNINVNIGKAAGQIVMHSHIHLIPRY